MRGTTPVLKQLVCVAVDHGLGCDEKIDERLRKDLSCYCGSGLLEFHRRSLGSQRYVARRYRGEGSQSFEENLDWKVKT